MEGRLTPYLMMNGNATEAIEFYRQVLGAEVLKIQTYGDLPMSFPTEVQKLVAHAMLKIGESEMMFSDSPGRPVQDGNKVGVCISTRDAERTKEIYDVLHNDGGTVVGPLETVPFSPAFGSVRDKFGVTFTIVTEL